MRAAIYARFSTDLQNDRSVEDQIALCEEFAARNGHEVTSKYFDRARTGATVHGRDGIWSLLDDARSGRFDVVIVEALDRLSRDQEDLAGIHKRLSFSNIEIITVHDGHADALQVGIRGLLSTLFLTDLKHKIRRGMGGVVADGRLPGGKAYGYSPVPGRPGEPEINPVEAETVRRIFWEYAAGRSCRDIAKGLNDDSVPSPRGGHWNASTINGNKERAYGILTNPIFIGQIVWNRVRMVRDPDTGKRVSRANPPIEWRRSEAPHLRIIDDELWNTVQDRKEGRSHRRIAPKRVDPRAQHLLTGLTKCSACGGSLTTHDRRGAAVRVTCSTAKESGSCDNRRRYRLDKIERAVVDTMVAALKDEDAVRSWLETVQAEERDGVKRRAKHERALASAQAKLDRLQMNLVDGRIDADFFDRQVGPLREAVALARSELDTTPAGNVVTLHPAALAEMAEVLTVLAEHLPGIDPREDREMFLAFRSLIDRVIVHDVEDGRVECEIIGSVSPLLGGKPGVSVVAEVRYSHIPPIFWGRARVA